MEEATKRMEEAAVSQANNARSLSSSTSSVTTTTPALSKGDPDLPIKRLPTADEEKLKAVRDLAEKFHALLDRALVDIHDEPAEGKVRNVEGDKGTVSLDDSYRKKGVTDPFTPIELL